MLIILLLFRILETLVVETSNLILLLFIMDFAITPTLVRGTYTLYVQWRNAVLIYFKIII